MNEKDITAITTAAACTMVSTNTKEAWDSARGFLGKLFGKQIEVYGLMLGDNASVWRFENQIKLIERVGKKLIESKIDLNLIDRNLAPDFLVPLIEAGCKTDSEVLQEMFAELLFSGLSPDTKDEVHPSYVKVIEQLSVLDAKWLKQVWMDGAFNDMINELNEITADENSVDDNIKICGVINSDITLNLRVSETESRLVQENLVRLGLIVSIEKVEMYNGAQVADKFILTQYGRSFAKVVM